MVTPLQQTRTSGVAVTIYSNGYDPVFSRQEKLDLDGRTESSQRPSIVGLTTSKSMGAAAGSWTITIKAPARMGSTESDFLEKVLDDDWIDIFITYNGKKVHVLRGLIDSIRWNRSANGQGATARVYTITGQDHGSILEKTEAWYNDFTAENTYSAITQKLLASDGQKGKDDPFIHWDRVKSVRRATFGFLETLTGLGHPDWQLPKSMPGRSASGAFSDTLQFSAAVSDDPKRYMVSTNFINPSGSSLWEFAQHVSDKTFTELFTDIGFLGEVIPPLDQGTPQDERGASTAEMVLFYREKPFPTTVDSSAWDSLAHLTVTPQAIKSIDVGRSGSERVTAILAVPTSLPESYQKVLTSPLWDKVAIANHGMRRLSVETPYSSASLKLNDLKLEMRAKLRDWHCLNAYFLSGSITFGALYPQLRIGMKLVVDHGDPNKMETYYVEQVDHSWSISGGITTARVTRGWIGTPASLRTAIRKVAGRFETLEKIHDSVGQPSPGVPKFSVPIF